MPWEPKGLGAAVAVPVVAEVAASDVAPVASLAPTSAEPALRDRLMQYRENQRGVSYDLFFGPYMTDVGRIETI